MFGFTGMILRLSHLGGTVSTEGACQSGGINPWSGGQDRMRTSDCHSDVRGLCEGETGKLALGEGTRKNFSLSLPLDLGRITEIDPSHPGIVSSFPMVPW